MTLAPMMKARLLSCQEPQVARTIRLRKKMKMMTKKRRDVSERGSLSRMKILTGPNEGDANEIKSASIERPL